MPSMLFMGEDGKQVRVLSNLLPIPVDRNSSNDAVAIFAFKIMQENQVTNTLTLRSRGGKGLQLNIPVEVALAVE